MLFSARPQRTSASRLRAAVSAATALGLAIAGLSLGAIPLSAAAATSNPFSSLHNFTVVSQGDAKLRVGGSGGEIEGSLASGGNVTFGLYNLLVNKDGSALPSVDGPNIQLFVKGAVTIDSGSNKLDLKGNAKIGTTTGMMTTADGRLTRSGFSGYVLNQSSTPQTSVAAYTATAGSYDAAFPASTFPTLVGYSEMYKSLTASTPGVVVVPAGVNDGGKLRLTLQSGQTSVLNVTRTQLENYSEINFASTAPSLSTPLIINVAPNSAGDTGSSFNPPRFTGSDTYYANFVLWNFPDFTKLTLTGSTEMGGAVLAPSADLFYERNNPLRGQIAAKTVTINGGGEIHHYGFKASLPDPRTVSATPTYADGTCAPSNRTNTLAAPAVDHVEYTWTANPTATLVGSTFASFSNTDLPAGTYSFSIAATGGYTLTGASSFSHTFTAPPADCRVKDATGTFSFTPPTCEVGASYTLGAASNATYTVSYGSTTETGKTAGSYPMQNGVAYTITVVPADGHALAAGVTESDSRTFTAPTDCVTVDAAGSFSFTPPTCDATGSYTLAAASNATYTVAYGSTTETGKTAGTYAMPNGIQYTISVVPNRGHALVAGVTASDSRTFTAPSDCVTTDATGSFSFTPPTCQAEASYTLGSAVNATYTVTSGSTTETGKTAGTYAMQTGVLYTVTVVPQSGHALMAGVVVSDSKQFEAVTGCVVQDATASFSFTPPTCDAAASYTLGAATNATFTVTYGSTTETDKTAGTYPMQNGVEYTVTIVPTAGHALVDGVTASGSRTFAAPSGCVLSTATGSFSFTPPTCEVPAGSYTLGAASNATYTVTHGSTSETVAAGSYAMPNDVAYTITVVPDAGYALASGVVATDTRTFSAPTDCISPNARGSFSFAPPTCEADPTYTLDPAINASYLVSSTTGRGTTVEEGTHPMELDSTYTITVVPDEGYALAEGVIASDSEAFAAPTDCVTQDARGSFGFVPPTCEAGAAYTLGAATNATYTVTFGSTTLTGRTEGTYSMGLDLEYTITVVPNAGHSLVAGVVPGSQTYSAPTNCVTTDAVGNFAFVPPTCTADASYTLAEATNATYTVTHGSTTETGKLPGSYVMELGTEYTITVVPNAGHALIGGPRSESKSYTAPENCAYVDTDPFGSVCPPAAQPTPPDGVTSWIWFLIDDRVIYTIGDNPERVTTAFVEVPAGTYVVHAVAAPGYVLAPSAEREWTIEAVDSGLCGREAPEFFISAALSTVCVADVPWINYRIELTDPAGQASSRNAEIILSDGTHTETIELGTIGASNVIEGRVLWPGAAVDAQGKADGWPGWQKDASGKWVQTTGNFAWTRALTSMTASVNPTAEVAISYPPATAACANPPVPPTLVTSLVNTGFGFTGVLSLAAGLAALGGLGLIAANRIRRSQQG